jgi:hypothetical protein
VPQLRAAGPGQWRIAPGRGGGGVVRLNHDQPDKGPRQGVPTCQKHGRGPARGLARGGSCVAGAVPRGGRLEFSGEKRMGTDQGQGCGPAGPNAQRRCRGPAPGGRGGETRLTARGAGCREARARNAVGVSRSVGAGEPGGATASACLPRSLESEARLGTHGDWIKERSGGHGACGAARPKGGAGQRRAARRRLQPVAARWGREGHLVLCPSMHGTHQGEEWQCEHEQ